MEEITKQLKEYAVQLGSALGNPNLFLCWLVDDFYDDDETADDTYARFMLSSDVAEHCLVIPYFIYNKKTGSLQLVRTHYDHKDYVIYEVSYIGNVVLNAMVDKFMDDLGEFYQTLIQVYQIEQKANVFRRKLSKQFEQLKWK